MTTTTTEAPPESKIATALAAFQAELPKVGKENTAKVDSDRGRGYTYRYADLSDISPEVLPLLAKHGLSWTCRPMLTHEGKFVLRYALMHTSGEVIDGDYPLPNPQSTSQALGSGITYARRYALCAVTGIAPGGDDDDAAAASQRAADRPQSAPRSQPAPPDQSARQRPTQPAAERPAEQPKGNGSGIPSKQVAAALSLLRQTCETNGWSLDRVAQLWADSHDGLPINAATSMSEIEKFRKDLFSRPDHELKEPQTDA